VLGGKWLLKRLIGAGGAGEVFDAEDTVLRRSVAVKVVRKSTREHAARLEREALLVASARHPNICDVYDLGTTPEGERFLVLERLFGEPLATSIRVLHTKESVPFIVDLFAQLLSAVHAAHGARIVHRDLSPKNVFLVDRLGLTPIVKVLDFGLARDVSGVRSTLRPAEGKVRLGTIAYMAPEQLRGDDVDRRSDIFAIGILLYQTLTGRHPFAATSFDGFQKRLLDEPAVPITEPIPPAVVQVVMRALAKNMNDRYANALEMQAELTRALRS